MMWQGQYVGVYLLLKKGFHLGVELQPLILFAKTFQNILTAGGEVLGTILTGLAPDRDDSDRAGYYADAAARGPRRGNAKSTARLKAEHSLRKQEKAWIRLKAKEARSQAPSPDDDDPGADV